MFFSKYTKFIVRVSAFLTSILLSLGVVFGDTFEPGTFPIISSEPQAEGTIRIVSFNLRCQDVNDVPVALRRSLPLAQIDELQPDSFGVQEATTAWMAYLRLTLPQYAAVGEGRDGFIFGEHSAVFYRRDRYNLIDSGTFWLSDTPDKPSKALDAACRRVCTWAILENKTSGQQYVHVNSHFDHIGIEARALEAEMIRDFIRNHFADLPVVFTADMNCDPEETAYSVMAQDLGDTRCTAQKVETYETYHDGDPVHTKELMYLDYIFVSSDFRPLVYKTVTSGIDGRFVSDHFPIYADLVLQ